MAERVENETFCERMVASACVRSDKIAMMVFGPDGTESITFGSMLAQIRSIAYRLNQKKVALGDRGARPVPTGTLEYLAQEMSSIVGRGLFAVSSSQTLRKFPHDTDAGNVRFNLKVSSQPFVKVHMCSSRRFAPTRAESP